MMAVACGVREKENPVERPFFCFRWFACIYIHSPDLEHLACLFECLMCDMLSFWEDVFLCRFFFSSVPFLLAFYFPYFFFSFSLHLPLFFLYQEQIAS